VSGAADYRIEIIKARPQGLETFDLGPVPVGDVIDVTSHVELDGFGSINRALESDLFSFKTGDITLTFDNPRGFFEDLFAFFGPDDMWGLKIYRRGLGNFYGCLIGIGSILFLPKDRQVEVTAYGLTKILDRTSAEGSECKRSFLNPPPTLTVATTPGVTVTLSLSASGTIGYATGDTLHLTDHVNAEDLIVKRVISGTSVEVETPTQHSYAIGTPVVCTTPFHRSRNIDFLVRALFKQAGFAMTDLRLSNSQFNTLGPTPVNLSGLPVFVALGGGHNPVYTNPSQKDGAEFITQLVDGTRSQASPDVAWVVSDATVQAWVDWSPYFLQGDAGPPILPRTPNAGEAVKGGDPHNCGWDLRGATMTMYVLNTGTKRLQKRTSTDGTTWTALADVTTPDVPGMVSPSSGEVFGCDYDPVRDQVLVYATNGATFVLQLYDVAGTSWTNLLQADDVGATLYGGFSYCRDLDCFIGLRGTVVLGPTFEAVAFRGTSRLWKRTFPGCLITTNGTNSAVYPTDSIRFVNGKLYTVVISDGEAQLLVTPDQFQTYTIRSISASGTGFRTFGARVNGAYVLVAYNSNFQRVLLYGAPFYAGVISYADFTGLSVGEGLKKLALLANALFRVDDDAQGRFVARDLYDPGAVVDVGDLQMDRTDDLIWEQTSQYVTVAGNGVSATAGNHNFAAQGIELDSSFLPNEATAQSLADTAYAFFSLARRYVEAQFVDLDGRKFEPLDRVTLGGPERYFVEESDHDLASDEFQLTLIEDR
jgi:hypothetical protein